LDFVDDVQSFQLMQLNERSSAKRANQPTKLTTDKLKLTSPFVNVSSELFC